MILKFGNSMISLGLVLLLAEMSLGYPYSSNSSTYHTNSDNGTLSAVLPENVNTYVTNTLENGLKVVSEISEGAKSTIDYFSGVAMKIEGIFNSLMNDLSGGGPKSASNLGKDDTQLDGRLVKLGGEVKKEWETIQKNKNYGLEREAGYFLTGARDDLLRAGRGKQFIGEKVKHINNGVNKMLIMLADETEDIQTKAKPVIDAIIKVDELIQTPEVQAIAQGLQSFGESITKALIPPEPCYVNYESERYVTMGYLGNKYWVYDEWIRCLSRRGYDIKHIYYEVSSRTGASMEEVMDYINYQMPFSIV